MVKIEAGKTENPTSPYRALDENIIYDRYPPYRGGGMAGFRLGIFGVRKSETKPRLVWKRVLEV